MILLLKINYICILLVEECVYTVNTKIGSPGPYSPFPPTLLNVVDSFRILQQCL
jgi:hypothetical protein